jgi:hypothetical protein
MVCMQTGICTGAPGVIWAARVKVLLCCSFYLISGPVLVLTNKVGLVYPVRSRHIHHQIPPSTSSRTWGSISQWQLRRWGCSLPQ